MEVYEIAIFGAIGSLAGESTKVFHSLYSMSDSRFKKMLRSPKLYSMVAILAIIGAVGALVINGQQPTSISQALATGVCSFATLSSMKGITVAKFEKEKRKHSRSAATTQDQGQPIRWTDVF
ncbi:MAG: hypothetical protein AAF065_12490 [Verrucomicrobiota bacterium]